VQVAVGAATFVDIGQHFNGKASVVTDQSEFNDVMADNLIYIKVRMVRAAHQD
jgi:hypothetical protein